MQYNQIIYQVVLVDCDIIECDVWRVSVGITDVDSDARDRDAVGGGRKIADRHSRQAHVLKSKKHYIFETYYRKFITFIIKANQNYN